MSEESEMLLLADTVETAPKADLTRVQVKTPRAVEIRKIRSSHAYKSGVEKFRTACSQQRNKDGSRGAPCWLCSQPIQYNLRFPHPGSFSVDHVIPADERPDLMLDTANWAASHFSCNSARGGQSDDLYSPSALGVPSEAW